MAFMQSALSTKNQLNWQFPLPRPHTGIALGNGIQGILIWGEEKLNLTVARAGFWDRRGGHLFTTEATYPKVRAFLEANDADGIRHLFSEGLALDGGSDVSGSANSSKPDRPYQIGGGRLELSFKNGMVPVSADLDLASGTVKVFLRSPSGQVAALKITQAMDENLAWIELDELAKKNLQVACLPSWNWVQDKLSTLGITPPQVLEIEDGGGFVQELPADDDLALVWRLREDKLFIATALGECEEAAKCAVTLARQLPDTDSSYFWKRYWADVPVVKLPDAELQHFWDLALFKQAGITTPNGVAATLQGPWMEEYQLPPWSNDYHLNINLEMIYWPALATNRLEHFKPLWEMIHKWLPVLKENGEKFFERPGALMLPHAVDDECHVVGTFWTGTIDHACTAWVAQMAWLQYKYQLEPDFLEETAWPLLSGAFEGYWAMHEVRAGRMSLPVSVSPEYRGSEMNAWGRDASFQLAAWHMISQILPQAAAVLGKPIDPRWAQVQAELPPYALVNGRIGLWEGLELEESHRHHSHLASIFPFASLDPFAEEHWETVAKSIHFWNKTGSGIWTGWCTPWASVLCSRLEMPDAAVTWLHWMLHNFTNVGWGTLHNADFAGTSAFDDGSLFSREKPEGEVMQMDATMGFLTAITELMVQNRRDGIYVLPKLPRRWRDLSFEGIRCEGAFLVSGFVVDGTVSRVQVTALKGGMLRLNPGLGARFRVDGVEHQGPFLEQKTEPGQQLVLTAM